jgi:fructose-bisphosphate aldolase, class II
VIVQATDGGRRYAGDRFLVRLVHAATEVYPEIPVALHLDHGNSVAACLSAIEEGFTSVMMDGSLREDGLTPAGFEENVAVTRETVERAHAVGVAVEGELGTIGGIEDGRDTGAAQLTDPDQAVEFVERTGIDALAVAIGTSSGISKFSEPPTAETLAMDVIEMRDFYGS